MPSNHDMHLNDRPVSDDSIPPDYDFARDGAPDDEDQFGPLHGLIKILKIGVACVVFVIFVVGGYYLIRYL